MRPCFRCSKTVPDTDRFCPHCGQTLLADAPPPRPQNPPPPAPSPRPRTTAPDDPAQDAVDRAAGMGRGLVTIVCSPLNFIRGASLGAKWASSSRANDGYAACGLVLIGSLTGTFAVCADVINGTLDVATFGLYGDRLYTPRTSGKPTPWVWERDWTSGKFPWIDKK